MNWKVYLLVSVIICGGVAASFFVLSYMGGQNYPTAIIVDNLAINYRNDTFVNQVKSLLEEAGFKVEYFDWDSVNLDLYRRLTRYEMIILRVHSHILEGTDDVCFFTSESIDKVAKYPREWQDYLVDAELPDGRHFIGIKPSFIRELAEGDFPNSTVIAMGCESLAKESMADAFIAKGAKVYIGWTYDVTLNYTDTATLKVLKCLFIENKTISEAVKGLIDPKTYAKLKYYPPEAGNLRIFEFTKKFVETEEYSFSHWCICYRRFFRKF